MGDIVAGNDYYRAGVYRSVSRSMESDDCVRIATDFIDVISQAVTTLCVAAIMCGAGERHYAGGDQRESGIKHRGKKTAWEIR